MPSIGVGPGCPPQDRMREFGVLQERAWGNGWRAKPMERIATWEKVDWLGTR